MKLQLVEASADAQSQAALEALYAAGYVAAEKKPFLVDLARSSGPYLRVANSTRCILDGASQIASLGLGLNHPALLGAAQHLETWLDGWDFPQTGAVRQAFADLLRRKLAEPYAGSAPPATAAQEHQALFCHSGAQAIEIALAAAAAARRSPQRTRILAFEGAFHGRTKIALETTYGPDKRLPFSWAEHAACFVPYPELPGAQIEFAYDRQLWKELWTQPDDAHFESRCDAMLPEGADPLLVAEVATLRAVRQQLRDGGIFCILLEPLQSEGGERYSSARFHQGLAWLAQAFAIPLIYDEIQCGGHLGRTFFWHRQFGLVDRADRPWLPDLVVCAKKTQVGVVLSRHPLTVESPPPCASLFRGYIQTSLLEQSPAEIAAIEEAVGGYLQRLAERWPQLVSRPRQRGLAFAFDLPTAELAKRFVERRFDHGLLFYPAGARTARFRLALAFGPPELALLFQQIDAALESISAAENSAPRSAPTAELRDPAPLYAFHARWLEQKLAGLQNEFEPPSAETWLTYLRDELQQFHPRLKTAEVVRLDPQSYPAFRDRMVQIQAEVYEPARQTPASDFDAVFASDHPLGLAVLYEGRLIGMAIAGSISQFAHVEGIPADPLHADPATVYMVDVTVVEEFRGGVGRVLKQALTLLAGARGVRWMVGRNRDRRARGMWAINLGLGAIQTQHLVESYDDDAPDRDCIVYHIATRWSPPPLRLASGGDAPCTLRELTPAWIQSQLPKVVNKLTLSNFVDTDFVTNLREAIELFPGALRHAYTASSLAEGVDKLVKVLHLARGPRRRLLTIAGHWFGDGTLLARGLSHGDRSWFDVVQLPSPESTDPAEWIAELTGHLASQQCLAVWVEPLPSRTLEPIPAELLRSIAAACRAADVPLVFQETAALFYRYSQQHFTASGSPDIVPAAVVADLSGQMTLCLVQAPYFDAAPLKLISTWDGDSFSLAKFVAAARSVTQDPRRYFQQVAQFEQEFVRAAQEAGASQWRLHNAAGWVAGLSAGSLAAALRPGPGGRHLVCPAPGEMERFLASRLKTSGTTT